VTIEPGAPLGEASTLMLERGVHHLVVMGSDAGQFDVGGVLARDRG
jgi:hypothetical protein